MVETALTVQTVNSQESVDLGALMSEVWDTGMPLSSHPINPDQYTDSNPSTALRTIEQPNDGLSTGEVVVGGLAIAGLGLLAVVSWPAALAVVGGGLVLSGCGKQTIISPLECVDEDDDGYLLEGCVDDPPGDDCNDNNASINPDEDEIPYDGVDQDCSGADLTDVDGDGYDAEIVGGDDCDDSDASIHPGSEPRFYRDADGDGYGDSSDSIRGCEVPEGYVENSDDCDDGDASVHPDAAENYINEVDDDCDGRVDDEDEDGYTITADGDCDDADPDINPGAEEECDDVDNDCNGEVDDGIQRVYFQDNDGDGYGTFEANIIDCSMPAGYAEDYEDCDDTDPSIHPGATEVAGNGVDENCNGYDGELTVRCTGSDYDYIQDAIDDAEVDGVVYVCADTYYEDLHVNNSITVEGDGGVTISGGDNHIIRGDTVQFTNLNFFNGYHLEASDMSALYISGCTFTANMGSFGTGLPAGAIYADSVDLVSITNSDFYQNEPMSFGYSMGGAITAWDVGFLLISGSIFENNQTGAGGWGGAISIDYGPTFIYITSSTFDSNESAEDGGALSLGDVSGTISGTTFSNNESEDDGGAISFGGSLTLMSCTVEDNTATGSAGGVYLGNGTLTSSGTSWSGNTPDAIDIYGGTSYDDSDLTGDFECSTDSGVCE